MRTIGSVAVLGAGTMGSGIAQVVARSGVPVKLYDALPGAAERSSARVTSDLQRLAERGKISPPDAAAAAERVSAAGTLADLAGADLVVEAVPEDLELKRRLFRDIDELLPGAVLATNTSTLSVSAIAGAVRDPSRVAGMHFFNPAPLMPLVEVVAGDLTAPEVVEAVAAFAARLGKEAVVARDTPGFIVNRVARPYYGEALRALADGAEPATIDRVLRGVGFRMGPLELMDLIGLDVNLAATRSVYDAYFGHPRYRPHPIQQRMVESGRLGRKSGRGFYQYDREER